MKKGKKGWLLPFLGGGAIGAANGLLGGGGGMVAVPVLRAGGIPARKAHATAIAVILPASAVSGLVYLLCGAAPPAFTVPVALGVTAGGFLGAKLLSFLPVRAITLLFGLLMLAAGWRMLF